jgi:predicted nucleic acid-binding protein
VIVLDTNVTSELMKPAPSATVAGWVRGHSATELYTTSITLAEIDYGIQRLPDGHRKDLLQATADEVFSAFTEHVLAFDAAAAEQYGQIVSHRDRVGAPIEGFDAQIASICKAHEATLATRNVKDFQQTGIIVVDPWRDRS